MSNLMLSLTSVTPGICRLSLVTTEGESLSREERTVQTLMRELISMIVCGAVSHDARGSALAQSSVSGTMSNEYLEPLIYSLNLKERWDIPISSLIAGMTTLSTMKAALQGRSKLMASRMLTILFLVSLVVLLVASTPPQAWSRRSFRHQL